MWGNCDPPRKQFSPFSSLPNKHFIPFKQRLKTLEAIKICILGVLILVFVASFSEAQNIPTGQDVGSQSQQFQRESEHIQSKFQPRKTRDQMIEEELNVQEALNEFSSIEDGGPSFVLKGVRISGNTALDTKFLEGQYASYINQNITMKDINTIISEIKSSYKQQGFFTSMAYLPEQDIKDGIVEIRIIEGKMGNLIIEDNKYYSSQWISRNIHLTKDKILDLNEFRKDLLRINRSDLQLKAVVAPGSVEQTSDITLKAVEQYPWHVGVIADNSGSRTLGKYKGGTYIRSSNFSGRGDSFFLSTLMNSRMRGESVNYKIPLGTRGTQLGLSYSRFNSLLGKEFKKFDIAGKTDQGSIEFSKELYLKEDFQANAMTGLEIKSIQNKVLGQRVSDDQLRIPYVGVNITETDSQGQTRFSPRVDFGTSEFLGASKFNHPSGSRAGTGGFYVKYAHSLSRTQRMPAESYLRLSSQFQMSSRTLPSSEQFQLGGEDSIRGYAQGDYLADLGGSAGLEWNFPMYLIPKDFFLPKQTTALRYQIEPYLFTDVGGGSLKKTLPGERNHKELWSVGGGVKLHLFKSVYFNADWGKAIGDDPAPGTGNNIFHFSFQAET